MGKSLIILLLFLIVQICSATTWYVSTAGNNANSGTSPGSAFATIQHAENQAGPGDSVIVANGSYAGFYVDVSGTSGAPIVFLANGNSVFITSPTTTMDGINVEGIENNTVDYIEINGFIVNNMPRNGIRLVWANNCIVRNCICTGNDARGILTGFTDDILIEHNECSYTVDEHGIYVSNSSDRSIIRYNSSHHNHGGGIQINADASLGGDGISTDPMIYGNILYQNALNGGGGAAINLDGVQGAFIYNNLIYENHATGIALFQIDGGGPSINATVVFNTIIQASDGRWCVLVVDDADGAGIHNNILINQHSFRGSIALSSDAFDGFASDYNIVINSFSDDEGDVILDFGDWQDLGYDLNSILVDDSDMDEIFINPGASDYHLLVTSAAVDAGNSGFSAGVTQDIEGNTRPTGTTVDMGAYEEQSVVLALDEEERILPGPEQRWIDYTVFSEEIIVSGLVAGDALTLYDFSGNMLQEASASEEGFARITLEGYVDGVYMLLIYRARQLVDSRAILHMNH